MRVLVTRPQEKAIRTSQRLEAMGHQPFQLPLFRPDHFQDAFREAIESNQWSALAVTSSEALHGVNAERDAPGMTSCPLFAVGEATAEVARATGFRNVISGKGDGQALADTIATFYGRQKAPLLYLAGQPRAPSFEHALKVSGIDFETVTVYVMQPIDYAPDFLEATLKQTRPDAVLLYSAAAAARFFALVSPEMLDALELSPEFLCMSKAVAGAVPKTLSALVHTAKTPSEDSLLQRFA